MNLWSPKSISAGWGQHKFAMHHMLLLFMPHVGCTTCVIENTQLYLMSCFVVRYTSIPCTHTRYLHSLIIPAIKQLNGIFSHLYRYHLARENIHSSSTSHSLSPSDSSAELVASLSESVLLGPLNCQFPAL